MYYDGDLVIYGIHGVCRVLCCERRIVDRKDKEYYVLEPIDQPNTRFYIPTQNDAAVAKMHRLLSKEEIMRLLQAQKLSEDTWIADENSRKQRYKDLIVSGDRAELIGMVHALHKHKQEQTMSGRKFHQCDENFLKDAEKILGSEFSQVLNIPQDQIPEFVMDILGEN